MTSNLNAAMPSSAEQITPGALKPWHRPELVMMPVESRTNNSAYAGNDGNGPVTAS
jgi:uncharacterized membrane protein